MRCKFVPKVTQLSESVTKYSVRVKNVPAGPNISAICGSGYIVISKHVLLEKPGCGTWVQAAVKEFCVHQEYSLL